MQLSQPTLEPHSLCYTLLSTSCVLTLAYSTLFLLFSLGTPYYCSVPRDAEEFTQSYQEYEDF